MAWIRGSHLAWFFLSIECECISRLRLAPERLIESFLESFRLILQLGAASPVAERDAELGGRALRRVDVTLDFAESDRRIRKVSVGVRDGVVRIFPALLNKALVG